MMLPIDRIRIVICVIVIIAFSMKGNAQKSSLISGDFNNLPVDSFLLQIEKNTPYHFFYDVKQLDSFRVAVSAKDETVFQVLQKAFLNTDILFSMDAQNRVFITRKVQLLTSLPPDFFSNSNATVPEKTNTVAAVLNRSAQKTTAENKVYEIGAKNANPGKDKILLTGRVLNSRSGEPVISASIFVEKLNTGVITDQYGYYTISLPAGLHVLNVQSIGMKDAKYQVQMISEGVLNIELKEQVRTLKEVVVSAQKVSNITKQMGMERLNIDAIKRVPTVFGEADIMKTILTLPGVKTVGEISSGFNVRGGSSDQNLVLMNGATIYNPSHFFGMFSVFNPELVKDIELYKSSIPAKFGGRLSSVLDINLREGNKKEITGLAGIGPVTSRFNMEGPLAKDRTSFIVGARSTYASWLLKLLPSPYDDASASFYDANIAITHKINNKNEIYLTGYLSSDKFSLASDTTYAYSNKNIAFKWKHNFSSKFLSYISTGYDRYNYNVKGDKNKVNAYTLSFDVNQFNLKGDFSYFINSVHKLDFGIGTIRYTLHPGSFQPKGKESLVVPDEISTEQAFETAVYLSDRISFSHKLSLEAGMRYSMFNYMGARNVNYYAQGLPRDESTVQEIKYYKSGQIINTYHGPEARLSFKYMATGSFSIKASYNSLRQYIHMLSNTTAIAPTDIWKLSDPNINPQRGDQVSLGFYKNLKSNTIEASFEIYYKKIRDYLDYKPGATLVMNHHIETETINTKGKAYGGELMIKKTAGKLNGWISYAYSRVLLKMDDPTVGNPVNNGNWYPANYDKPHDITTVGNFKVNHRFNLSLNVTYSTGRPITLPTGRFYYAGSQRLMYSERNAYRIPDYFRTDFSMNIDGNHKVHQKTHNSWTLGVYNLTGRRNAFSIYYVSENGEVKSYRLSIFGSLIPFVNFNIKF
jgi:hypothetical protein